MNMTHAIHAAVPAMPENPKNAAARAIKKNSTAAPNMLILLSLQIKKSCPHLAGKSRAVPCQCRLGLLEATFPRCPLISVARPDPGLLTLPITIPGAASDISNASSFTPHWEH
jgi:hypothetical protein